MKPRKNMHGAPSIQWSVLVGHAVHVAWGWLMFTGSLFSEPGGDLIDSIFLPDPLYTLSLGANAATLLAFALSWRKRAPLFKQQGASLAAMILMSVGTLLASQHVVLLFGQPTALVETLAGVLTGVGAAIFLLLWGEIFVALGVRGCLVYFAASSFLAAAVRIGASFLPGELVQITVSLLPILEFVLYRVYVSAKRLTLSKANRCSNDPSPVPLNIIVLGLFFGFSFGAMRGFISLSDHGDLGTIRTIVSMAFVMVGCTLAYVVSVLRSSDFGNLTYRIAIPLVALGFLLLPLSSVWSLVGTAVYRSGYEYVYIILWVLWVYCAQRPNTSSTWNIACGLASIQISKFVGFAISADAIAVLNEAVDLSLVSSVSLFAIVVFSLYAKESHIQENSWEEVRPASVIEMEPPFAQGAYAPIVEKFGLSPRETEVFYLILRGRSRAHIAKELVVTEETVKSHIANIYQKAGVHTKQDLIDRVEDVLRKDR